METFTILIAVFAVGEWAIGRLQKIVIRNLKETVKIQSNTIEMLEDLTTGDNSYKALFEDVLERYKTATTISMN